MIDLRRLGLLAWLMMAGACSSEPSSNPPPPPGTPPGTPPPTNPPASSGEIKSCKDACNQLKFFQCNDSVEQAGCFRDCDAATSAQIELFTACVKNDICDATCSTQLRPANPPPPVMSGGSDCEAACGRLVSAGCLPAQAGPQCNAFCGQGVSERGFVIYCEAGRSGCMFPQECGDLQPDPARDCRSACDEMASFSCIQAADQADCRNLCGTVAAMIRDNFTACVSAGICHSDQCYKLINPNGAHGDVDGCKMSCDHLKFFDCIDATTQSMCRTRCDTATSEKIETFKSCTMGVCTDDSCYQTLISA